MSTSLLVVISVATVAVVGVAGWMLARGGGAGPAKARPSPVPRAHPEDERQLDPADRTTLPPTVGLYEEDDEDAVTVMASKEDMAALLGQLKED